VKNPWQSSSPNPIPKPKTFEEFFPHYLAAHSKPVTQWIHVAFTLLGAMLILAALFSGKLLWLLAAPFVIYGPLFFSHFVFEKNQPASFHHPLWSVRGDLRMTKIKILGLWSKQ